MCLCTMSIICKILAAARLQHLSSAAPKSLLLSLVTVGE
jgi:hypothetical protein